MLYNASINFKETLSSQRFQKELFSDINSIFQSKYAETFCSDEENSLVASPYFPCTFREIGNSIKCCHTYRYVDANGNPYNKYMYKYYEDDDDIFFSDVDEESDNVDYEDFSDGLLKRMCKVANLFCETSYQKETIFLSPYNATSGFILERKEIDTQL